MNLCKFKATLVYTATSRTARATLSQKQSQTKEQPCLNEHVLYGTALAILISVRVTPAYLLIWGLCLVALITEEASTVQAVKLSCCFVLFFMGLMPSNIHSSIVIPEQISTQHHWLTPIIVSEYDIGLHAGVMAPRTKCQKYSLHCDLFILFK